MTPLRRARMALSARALAPPAAPPPSTAPPPDELGLMDPADARAAIGRLVGALSQIARYPEIGEWLAVSPRTVSRLARGELVPRTLAGRRRLMRIARQELGDTLVRDLLLGGVR